jgi:hypothetical protein
MNLQRFSMIPEARVNSAAYGYLTGVNKWVGIIGHVFAAGMFMSVIAMFILWEWPGTFWRCGKVETGYLRPGHVDGDPSQFTDLSEAILLRTFGVALVSAHLAGSTAFQKNN